MTSKSYSHHKIATSARFPRHRLIAPRRLSTCPRARSLSARHPRPPAPHSSQVPRPRFVARARATPRSARHVPQGRPLRSQLLLTSARAEMSCAVERAAAGGGPRGCAGAAAQSARLTPLGSAHAQTQLIVAFNLFGALSEARRQRSAGYLPLARRCRCPSRDEATRCRHGPARAWHAAPLHSCHCRKPTASLAGPAARAIRRC